MDNNVYYDHTSRHFNVAHTDIGNYSMENRFMEGGQVMTDEEKKAIWWLEEIVIDKEEYIKYHGWVGTKTLDNIEVLLNLIEKQDKTIKGNECVIETGAHNEKVLLEALEKKDKIIDGMARSIANYDSQLVINRFKDKEHVKEFYKEYFEKEKVQKMSWELHKKKDKKLYAIYSTVIDDYITEFEDKEDIEDFLIKTYTGKAYIKAKEFMKEVNKEV